MQQTRRLAMMRALRLIVLAVCLWAPVVQAANDLASASEFVRQAGHELAAIMSGAGSDADKQRQMQAFIDRVADVEGVARFSLGRYWPQATPAQRAEFIRLFHAVLVNSVSGQSNQYQHETAAVTVAQAETRADGMHVATTVVRGNQPAFHVTWVVGYDTGSPKIIDVIAEGISLRVTQRSDYVSFLSRNDGDIDALIKAVQQQLHVVAASR